MNNAKWVYRGINSAGNYVYGDFVQYDAPFSTVYWKDFPCRITYGRANCAVRQNIELVYTVLWGIHDIDDDLLPAKPNISPINIDIKEATNERHQI